MKMLTPFIIWLLMIFLFIQFLVSWVSYSSFGLFPVAFLISTFTLLGLLLLEFY